MMTIRTKYVLGFFFSEDRSRVLLILKDRPSWQKGRYNGIGGKIEVDETPKQAIDRECREEIGLSDLSWEDTVIMEGENWEVHCFRAFGNLESARSMESEQISVFETNKLPLNAISNIKWLVPLNLDNRGVKFPFLIPYKTIQDVK